MPDVIAALIQSWGPMGLQLAILIVLVQLRGDVRHHAGDIEDHETRLRNLESRRKEAQC